MYPGHIPPGFIRGLPYESAQRLRMYSGAVFVFGASSITMWSRGAVAQGEERRWNQCMIVVPYVACCLMHISMRCNDIPIVSRV